MKQDFIGMSPYLYRQTSSLCMLYNLDVYVHDLVNASTYFYDNEA